MGLIMFMAHLRNTWNATLCYVHAQLRTQTHGMLRCARSMYDSGWNTTVGLHLASLKEVAPAKFAAEVRR